MKTPWAGSILLVLLGVPHASGQIASASGRVTDPAGWVIPETIITLTNADTGIQRRALSNEVGYYFIPLLQPGSYRVAAQKSGFRPVSRDGIVVRVGDRITLNIAMEIGRPTETVTVTGDAPALRTEDAQAGAVIDGKRIQELPQYNRNPFAFAQLVPNVAGSSEQTGYSNDFRINGGRTSQAEYFLDGVPITTGYLHDIAGGTPSMEAISEFRVITNGLSAEYGRLSGGVVVVATKYGTNDLHGNLYEFFRNEKLNASSWAENKYGTAKGAFHNNVFGFSVGGPVIIPRTYNGREKTFFFLNYEGLRHSSGSAATRASVPTPLEREGDFSQSLLDSRPVQIYDWTTGRLENGRVVRDPFPGNRIPESRIDPIAKIYLGYYPMPNRDPVSGTTSDNNYLYSSGNHRRSNRWTGRIDENWNSRQVTRLGLTWYEAEYRELQNFSDLRPVSTTSSPSKVLTLEHTWIPSSTSMLSFRGGVVRNTSESASEVNVDTSLWPLHPDVRQILGSTKGTVPAMWNLGVTPLGGGSIDKPVDTSYTASIAFHKLRGRHTVRLGFEHRRYYTNELVGGDLRLPTDRVFTARSPDERYSSGSRFASWLLGRVFGGGGDQIGGPASAITYYAAYVDDDYRVTGRLNVNLGLRWDYETPRTERFNRMYQWDLDYRWDISPSAGWNWDAVEAQVGRDLPQPEWLTKGIYGRVAAMGTPAYPMRTLQQAPPDHFGPHLGLAYQFLPHTVLRVSYGLNWMTTTGSYFLGSARWNVGYADKAMFPEEGTYDGGLTYPISFSNPFPNGAGYVRATQDIDLLNRQTQGSWWLSPTRRLTAGHEHVVQLSVQREFGKGAAPWLIEAAYTGNLGRSLPAWIGPGEHIVPDAYHKIGSLGTALLTYVDNPFYGQLPAGARGGQTLPLGNVYQQNPLWMQISTQGDGFGTSNYNAGYIQVERRFGSGFGILANYTLGKLMQDTGSNDDKFTQGAPQAGLSFGDVYGLSKSDFRHKFLVNYSIDLPIGRGRRLLGGPQSGIARLFEKAVGGWSAAGTTTIRSGTPLSVLGANSHWWQAGEASNGDSERPVYVNRDFDNHVSGHAALDGAPGAQPYLNISAFRRAQGLPDLLEIGDVGSVIPMRGPAFSQVDLALMKKIPLGTESRYLQLRIESQNAFNHMNAGNPGTDLNNPRYFGVITTQNGTPRRVMIAAKIYF
jgi:hypothetical protein